MANLNHASLPYKPWILRQMLVGHTKDNNLKQMTIIAIGMSKRNFKNNLSSCNVSNELLKLYSFLNKKKLSTLAIH